MVAHILCIGESDACAGTGIQADIKTVQAFGGYASTIVTAVSVQSTGGVFASHVIPPLVVRSQIEHIVNELKPSVIKTGILGNIDTINMLGDILDAKENKDIRVVIDPVMTNPMGHTLLDKDARDALKRRLLIHADVLTPDIGEAYDLSGIKINNVEDMRHAAETLRTLGAGVVILKGGMLAADHFYDVLADDDGARIYQYDQIDFQLPQGAGATLSAGIAVGLAQGLDVHEAYKRARRYVNQVARTAVAIGGAYKPLNHTLAPEAA